LDKTKQDIRALIRLFEESDWDDIRVETNDLKLTISKNSNTPGLTVVENGRRDLPSPSSDAPVESPAIAEPAPEKGPVVVPEGMIAVTAPSLGTFWRAPKPGADPFIETGQNVDEDTTLCLIEVMKLFTPIKAGVSGTVTEIVTENSEMVESGDVLILIDPAS
jgi:acetyl-CoA carboxylase biotin carboxyl carrier protein